MYATLNRAGSRHSLRQPMSSSQPHTIGMNRIDLILPGNRHISIPVFDDSRATTS
jgi:hypothetical protein